MSKVPTLIVVAAALALVGIPSGIAGETDREREFAAHINDANAALRNEDFDAAISGYELAAEIDSDRDEVLYNKAVALYRKGDVTGAETLFSTVAKSLDREMASKARFNAGNCHYAAAVESRDEDRASAIGSLQQAIEDYRSALQLDPTDIDARTNIELAARLLRQLQQEDQQQEQQQQQDQQQDQQQQEGEQGEGERQEDEQQSESSSDQSQNDGDQQQDAAQQGEPQDSGEHSPEQESSEQESSEQESSEQESSEQESSEQESSEQESSEQQKSGESQDADSQSQQDEPQSSPSENRPPSRSDPAQNESAQQSEDDSAAAEQSAGEDGEPQETPRGQLTAGNESDEASESDRSMAIGGSDREGELTEQEAYKMLQAIRDRDMLRRMRREADERSRRTPVDRDW